MSPPIHTGDTPVVRRYRRRFVFGGLALAAAGALVVWLWGIRSALDVSIQVLPGSLSRYDDGDGTMPLGAWIRVTNVSEASAWYIGRRGSPPIMLQCLVDGEWTRHLSFTSAGNVSSSAVEQWAEIRPLESLVVMAGPIPEEAKQIRVGFPLANDRNASEVRWMFSTDVEVVEVERQWFTKEASASAH